MLTQYGPIGSGGTPAYFTGGITYNSNEVLVGAETGQRCDRVRPDIDDLWDAGCVWTSDCDRTPASFPDLNASTHTRIERQAQSARFRSSTDSTSDLMILSVGLDQAGIARIKLRVLGDKQVLQ